MADITPDSFPFLDSIEVEVPVLSSGIKTIEVTNSDGSGTTPFEVVGGGNNNFLMMFI
jgi:hypothetical protein